MMNNLLQALLWSTVAVAMSVSAISWMFAPVATWCLIGVVAVCVYVAEKIEEERG